MQPTRISVDGQRLYRTNLGTWLPSVTTILSKTASPASQSALRSWCEKNPGAKEAAAERGTAVHAACEAYIRGRPVNVPPEYQCYWDGLAEHLDKFDSFQWSERPLLPQHLFCTGDDGISRVWSHAYGYSGCPDLVGTRGGVAILADFKTSVSPYCRWFPREPDQRSRFSGWIKYSKCAEQLSAYALAIKETLGINIDVLQILVSTPETTQSFYIHGPERKRYEYKWLQRIRKYQELKAAEQQVLTYSPP